MPTTALLTEKYRLVPSRMQMPPDEQCCQQLGLTYAAGDNYIIKMHARMSFGRAKTYNMLVTNVQQ